MASIEELRTERKKKRDILRDFGMDPYPVTSARTHALGSLKEDFDTYVKEETRLQVAGRIMAIREHGNVTFFDLFDGTEEVQVVIKQDEVENSELFDLFADTVDTGDFVDVAGTAFYTKTEQASVLLKSWQILSKSIRPIPDQFHGLEDKETRLRKRYLDILMNEEVRDMVKKRALFWSSMRSFLEENDFLEVQTPVLETTPGGADARPFASYHNALDMEVFLRISAGELWQKKLLVAGFDKVFEIGRIFRNEGISPEHAQDYVQMEFYWGYADYTDGMKFVEKLYKHVAQETFGTLEFEIGDHTVDLGSEWKQYDYAQTIQEITGIDIKSTTIEEIASFLADKGVTLAETDRNHARATDRLWKFCRKQITGPGFLVNVPKELSPLAKTQTGDGAVVAQFQPIIAGSELGKGYSELNNPEEQTKRFMAQEELRAAGDDEAQRFARDFVEALEYGMPPACGFGTSERLFSFLMDLPIREAQIFPLLKPEQS
ncbi:MAG: lysine--tRNA ligase [Candidatus Paceibacterota bacterium]